MNYKIIDKSILKNVQNYTELRMQENTIRNVSIDDGVITANSSYDMSGVSARVLNNGSYGFSSGTDYSLNGIKRVLESANRNAKFLASKVNNPIKILPNVSSQKKEERIKFKSIVTQKDIIDFSREIDSYIKVKYPNILTRNVDIYTLDIEKYLITTDNVNAYSLIPRAVMNISMTVLDKNGHAINFYKSFGGHGFFDEVFLKSNDYFSNIDEIYTKVIKKSEGVYAESGVKEVILHSNISGMLAHEAIGHAVEADFVQAGSKIGKRLGEKVANDKISIIDFANTAFGEECPVPIYIDDEGTPAEDSIIIKNGYLTEYLNNKESSLLYNQKPRGNARAYGFSDEPLIRMRNTCIAPGNSKFKDMIESIDDGYLLEAAGPGEADSNSEFMFGIIMGYEIKNGKVGKAIKDLTISGMALDVLNNVKMVSDEVNWNKVGICGKKQPIPVSMGGPAIKTIVNIGGR